ncbi:hypothetical protein UA08_02474 [Talaromyces atroroseus]|uniref:Uncharacterized protein n=1 Tax=Talaromyces atroroseus TaxID=1441469 RepID=A0A225B4H8_TALAT|nr:hypothetical protein UA08_02474 [Talaromyces atroroseus]OKL62186.1 hypothetical protein UA08_02474 [Talaromyces atroroseus]
MSASQPPLQAASSLKRKASTELPSDYQRAVDTLEPFDQHGVYMATLYEEAYAETTAEIKKLLRTYASAAAGCAASNNAAEDYHHDVTHELEAILNDLASKPEMFEINEVKSVLSDCGIDIEVRHNEAGGKFVNVQLRMGE